MSWQRISIPGSGSDNILLMFRSGLHYDADQPTITLTEYAESVPVSDTFIVGLSLSDSLAGPILDVFVVTNWDVSSISRVGSEVTFGNYDLSIDLGSSLVSLGTHTLTFCAVNDFGFVWQGYSVSVPVIATAMHAPSESAHATVSPVASQSLAPFPTPIERVVRSIF
jgi:hypothetical protein